MATTLVKHLKVRKSFRVSIGNRNVRLEPGLECEIIDETLMEYCVKIESGLEWWIPKDKLSFYFEEVPNE